MQVPEEFIFVVKFIIEQPPVFNLFSHSLQLEQLQFGGPPLHV